MEEISCEDEVFLRNNLYIWKIDNFTCLEFNFSLDLVATSKFFHSTILEKFNSSCVKSHSIRICINAFSFKYRLNWTRYCNDEITTITQEQELNCWTKPRNHESAIPASRHAAVRSILYEHACISSKIIHDTLGHVPVNVIVRQQRKSLLA